MNNFSADNYGPHNWMAATPAIDNLSFFELTLPGAHNAGCDREASYALIPGSIWTACQDVPFYAQLNRGARALDVRLTFDGKANDLKKLRFQHNGFLSSRHLGDLILEINSFLERSRDEFIILDFHELKGGAQAFDYPLFNDLMLKHLGERMIPVENMRLPLGVLKNINPLQRILVAAPRHHQLDYKRFCEKIEHKWIDQKLVNINDLYKYITQVMETPPGSWKPWSLSATCYGVSGPSRILDQLDAWFDPSKNDWAQRCNIINFDFIKNTQIVSFCRTANLVKARKKAESGQ